MIGRNEGVEILEDLNEEFWWKVIDVCHGTIRYHQVVECEQRSESFRLVLAGNLQACRCAKLVAVTDGTGSGQTVLGDDLFIVDPPTNQFVTTDKWDKVDTIVRVEVQVVPEHRHRAEGIFFL